MSNNSSQYLISSERLHFREFQLSDASKLYELNSDPEVIRYTGDTAFESIEQAREFVQNYSHYNKYGFGRWACIHRKENEFIGWCGLKNNEQGMIDLGFRFFRKYWNQGFATEAAKTSLRYGFEKLEIAEIVGRVAPDNIASIKVLEKLRMSYWKQGECHGIPDSHYYRIKKEDYEAMTS